MISPLRSSVPLLIFALAAPAIAGYTITTIPLPPGATSSVATGINSSGQVALTCTFSSDDFYPPRDYPYIYQNGQLTALALPAGSTGGSVSAINASGVAVGSVIAADGNTLPAMWQNNALTVLDTGGFSQGSAASINSQGQIVGSLTNYSGQDPQISAAIWNNTVLTNLGNEGTQQAAATDINDQVQITISTSDSSSHTSSILLHDSNGDHPLGNLGKEFTVIRGINNNGVAVGYGVDANDSNQAFRWQNGAFTTLAVPSADRSAVALDINDNDQAVGWGFALSGLDHALLWQADQVTDLNDLIPSNSGWVLINSYAIGADGSIVGQGLFNNELRAFLLTPSDSATLSTIIPEPATAALLLLATLPLFKRNNDGRATRRNHA